MSKSLLFSPLQVRGVTLRNRVVVAPMHQYSAVEGMANDWHLVNAGKFAQGGAGLVMMESTKIARAGCGTVGDVGLWDDKFIPPLARCASFIKAHGAAAGIQLGHSGRKARIGRPWEGGAPLKGNEDGLFDWEGWEVVAPSAIPHSDKSPMPRALSHNEIRDLAVQWGQAAERAHKAGFDVVEIHAAHGFLIHEFLSPAANTRTDSYGGSEVNRMRFAIEVTECVRSAWPEDKPLFVRLSCEDDAGWGPEESVRLSRHLKEKGADVVDCSSGGLLAFSPKDSERSRRYGYQVPYAEKIRREAGIMTMSVGHIVHADQAEAILQEGRSDLVALGRELLYNPNWPMDAAQKLSADPDFALLPAQYSYWLGKRAKSQFEGHPSTWSKAMRQSQ
jgi:2,4-dienoyl-CoA reductase-like NADH-dependent reductase (Old Yellow Enzyme family)